MRIKLLFLTILLTSTLRMSAQSFTLQGKVTDEQMNPVELATVSVIRDDAPFGGFRRGEILDGGL